MRTDDRGQREAEERYWRAVAEDADTPPPEGLDPVAAELVRGLRDLRPPEPDPTFIARLGERLQQATTTPPAPIAERGRLRVLRAPGRGWRRPALAGLAAAATLVLAVVAFEAWRSPVTVDAAAILRQAERAAGAGQFRSFAITEVAEQHPAAVAGSDDLVRSEIARWYEAPGRWRREVISTVLGPDGAVKSRGGLVSVSDGASVWIHRLRDNTVIVRPAGAAGEGELGPFPEVTGGLSGLLSQAGDCYTPRVAGSDTVAGRAVHVIELGRSRCALSPDAAAGSEQAAWTVWVDKQTFLILKSVQEVDGAVVATTTVTSIDYDAPQDAGRFRFAPPPDARIRDTR